eukprot:1168117-Amphidinium_carterae.1
MLKQKHQTRINGTEMSRKSVDKWQNADGLPPLLGRIHLCIHSRCDGIRDPVGYSDGRGHAHPQRPCQQKYQN